MRGMTEKHCMADIKAHFLMVIDMIKPILVHKFMNLKQRLSRLYLTFITREKVFLRLHDTSIFLDIKQNVGLHLNTEPFDIYYKIHFTKDMCAGTDNTMMTILLKNNRNGLLPKVSIKQLYQNLYLMKHKTKYTGERFLINQGLQVVHPIG